MMQNKKHIAFVAPTAYRYYQGSGFGGAELQIVRLAGMFADAGYQVTVLTNDYGQKKKEIHDGVTVLKAPLRFFGGSNFYFLIDSIRFIYLLVRLEPDFCFMKNPNTILFLLAVASKINRKIQCVKLFASDADWNVRGKGIAAIMYRLGVKWTERFIFQTQRQQQMAKENLGKDGIVIRNIFSPPPDEYENVEKDIDVLWVGNFDKYKFPEGFYETAKALPQYRFGMISKMVPETYKDLYEKITALPNVRFFGRVPFQETQRYFQRSKIFLCTSVVEGFPNTFLQAWFSRIPVVSLTFSCDDILEQFGIGKVSGSLDKLEEDISYLLQNQIIRNEMGNKGFLYIQENHFPDCILKKYQDAMSLWENAEEKCSKGNNQ